MNSICNIPKINADNISLLTIKLIKKRFLVMSTVNIKPWICGMKKIVGLIWAAIETAIGISDVGSRQDNGGAV